MAARTEAEIRTAIARTTPSASIDIAQWIGQIVASFDFDPAGTTEHSLWTCRVGRRVAERSEPTCVAGSATQAWGSCCEAAGGGTEVGVEVPAGEAGWPPRGEGGRVRAGPG